MPKFSLNPTAGLVEMPLSPAIFMSARGTLASPAAGCGNDCVAASSPADEEHRRRKASRDVTRALDAAGIYRWAEGDGRSIGRRLAGVSDGSEAGPSAPGLDAGRLRARTSPTTSPTSYPRDDDTHAGR